MKELQSFISEFRERLINKIDQEIQQISWQARLSLQNYKELKKDYKNFTFANKLIQEKSMSGEYLNHPKLYAQEIKKSLRLFNLGKVVLLLEQDYKFTQESLIQEYSLTLDVHNFTKFSSILEERIISKIKSSFIAV